MWNVRIAEWLRPFSAGRFRGGGLACGVTFFAMISDATLYISVPGWDKKKT